jgi:hypothetical protein
LDQALFKLGPGFALSFHEQGKDLDLAADRDALLSEQLLVVEEADGFRPDLPSDTRFLEGFARGRFRRSQPLYRPAFRNDPAFGSPGGYKQDFEPRLE